MYPDQAVYQASARESSREMPATFEEQPGNAALTERREAGRQAALAVGTGIHVDHRRAGAKERLPSSDIRRGQGQNPSRNRAGAGNQVRRGRDAQMPVDDDAHRRPVG